MAIWDKLKTELDRAGKAAQNALALQDLAEGHSAMGTVLG